MFDAVHRERTLIHPPNINPMKRKHILLSSFLFASLLFAAKSNAQTTELTVINNTSSDVEIQVHFHDGNCNPEGSTGFIEVSASLTESIPELSLAQKLYSSRISGGGGGSTTIENTYACDQSNGSGEFEDGQGNTIYVSVVSEFVVEFND